MLPENLPEDAADPLPGPDSARSIRTWITLVGAALVILGGYLPWLRYNPDYEGVGIVLSPQLRPGFEWVDLILLSPVVLIMAVIAVRGPKKWWARGTAIVGLAAVLLPALVAGSYYTDPNPYFLPDVGLALTALGGVLLLVAGGYDRYGAD